MKTLFSYKNNCYIQCPPSTHPDKFRFECIDNKLIGSPFRIFIKPLFQNSQGYCSYRKDLIFDVFIYNIIHKSARFGVGLIFCTLKDNKNLSSSFRRLVNDRGSSILRFRVKDYIFIKYKCFIKFFKEFFSKKHS